MLHFLYISAKPVPHVQNLGIGARFDCSFFLTSNSTIWASVRQSTPNATLKNSSAKSHG